MKTSHIVFAGNNSRLAMLLSRFFQDIGFQLTMVAGNGARAIEVTRKLRPLMVFINSPLDGPLGAHETAMEIEQTHGVPVVMVNDTSDAEDVQASFNVNNINTGELFHAVCGIARDVCGIDPEKEPKA